MTANIALPAALIAFFLLAMVWPTVRTYRRHGVWPVVFRREADPFQRLIGVVFGLCLGGVFLWSGLGLFVAPSTLGVWSAPAWIAALGWSLMGGSTLMVLIAQLQMGGSWRIGIDDRPTALVTSGLFGLVRNPIFSGMLALLLGVVLITPSPWTVMGFFFLATLIAVQVRLEERHLIELHGERYLRWASRVGRFMPLVGRLSR